MNVNRPVVGNSEGLLFDWKRTKTKKMHRLSLVPMLTVVVTLIVKIPAAYAAPFD